MSGLLVELARAARENGENLYSLVEYRDGRIQTLDLQPANAANNLYSISKVFTMTAIGMLADEGRLDVQETVTDILKDELPATYDERWTRTTVDMLLRHRIALEGGALDIDGMDASLFEEDYLDEAMNLPWHDEPGETRVYTDAAYYILSRIVAARAGEPLQNFLWKRMFRPMAFQEAAWSCCPKGHAMGATGLYLRPADMIKIGALYLQKGLWNGKRIVSEAWVEAAMGNYELLPQKGTKALCKGGMFGQMLALFPEQSVAVGWLGHRSGSKVDLVKTAADYIKSEGK